MKDKKAKVMEMLEQIAKTNDYNLDKLNLNYDKCSVSFLNGIMSYIQREEDPLKFIRTCEILFPENPADLSEDIAMAIPVIDREGTTAMVKQEIDAGRCEISMEGLVFESMYQKAIRASNTTFTGCGRLVYDDKYGRGLFGMDIFMSEGIEKARKIYADVKRAYNHTHKELANQEVMFGHLIPGYTLELAMDDMNIRGQQIIYGYEYANHSAGVLAELISKRDKDLIAYINKRMVEEYDNTSGRFRDCLAVDGGASFDKKPIFSEEPFWGLPERPHTKYDPLIDNAEEIIGKCTKEYFEIDYASMDINGGTLTEEGIKIAKAHGFEMVWAGDIKNSDVKSILMVSKDKDAILYARAKGNDVISYGGCDIFVATNDKDVDYKMFSWEQLRQNYESFGDRYQEENNPYRSFKLRDCHYERGCFKQYKFLKQAFPVRAEEIPWEAAPVSGLSRIPIPEAFELPSMFFEERESLIQLLHTSDFRMTEYYIQRLINRIYFVREILPGFSQEMKSMYVRYDKEPYKAIAETLPYYDIDETVKSVGIAFRYLNLPEDEEEKYLLAIRTKVMEYVKSEEDVAYATKQWNRIKEDIDTWDKALEIMLPDDYVREVDYER